MDQNQMQRDERRRLRRRFGAAGFLGAGLLAGAILAGPQIAQAANSGPSTPVVSSSARAVNPAQMAHGPGEKLVTGADLTKLTSEAKKAVPGARIIRVESDRDGGAVYEAHMQKPDGSYVTVQFDGNLNVTGTMSGFGAGGPMPRPAN